MVTVTITETHNSLKPGNPVDTRRNWFQCLNQQNFLRHHYFLCPSSLLPSYEITPLIFHTSKVVVLFSFEHCIDEAYKHLGVSPFVFNL